MMGFFDKIFRRSKKKGNTTNSNDTIKQLKEEIQAIDDSFEGAFKLLQQSDCLADKGKYAEAIDLRKEALMTPNTNFSFKHYKELYGLMIKNGSHDQAWALLNQLVVKYPNNLHQIRDIQRKQLSREKKHLDALTMGILVVLHEAKNKKALSGSLPEINIEKTLVPLIKKANVDDLLEQIKLLIEESLKEIEKLDESKVTAKFKKIVDSKFDRI